MKKLTKKSNNLLKYLVTLAMLLISCNLFAQPNWYVNDIYTPLTDTFTTSTGSNTNPGTSALPFATIQRAIDTATAGDTIYVDAGTYSLTAVIVVDKQLTIRGRQVGHDARTRGAVPESIVDAIGLAGYISAFGVKPAANGSIIDGFTIENAVGSGALGTGILLEVGTNGTTVQNNIIQDNVVGLYLANNSASNQTVIRQNLFQNNTAAGAASGHGIYADNSTASSNLQNVLIEDNIFTNDTTVIDSWALGLGNVGAIAWTNITFQDNEVSNLGRGMYFFGVTSSTVTRNTFTGTTNYAIGIFNSTIPNDSITVTNNIFSGNNRGVWIDPDNAVNTEIHDNSITGSTLFAIQNDDIITVDATCNWYGSADSTTAAAEISGPVTFVPYLTNGTDDQPDTTGFQPVPGSCDGPPCLDSIAPVFNPPTPCDSLITVSIGDTITFTVTAKDNSADSITLDVDSLPAGATMTPALPDSGNPVSSVFNWITSASGFQSVSFTATDSCGNSTKCRISFEIVGPCPDSIAPEFNPPTPCDSLITGSIGDTITFTVTAKDNSADSITLDVDSLPAGATMTPALPDSGNPVSSVFNWIPAASGFQSVSFTATDSCGNQTKCRISFEIVGPCRDSIAPVFNPPTPCDSVISPPDTGGVAITFKVEAKDNSEGPITLDVDSLPPGATMTPPLPDSGNPVSSIFSWTPTSYGPFTVSFTATDSCGNQTKCRVNFDVVLPVELTSFTSLINNNEVTLNWSTATESNNSRFEIERANGNSQEWNEIGTIQGNGNSTQPISYSFVDRGLNVGNYNYRLKQIDFNGNFAYHNLSNDVVIGVPTRFNLSQNYPNPFNPSTKIDFEIPKDGNVNLYVYDISGKQVSTLVSGFRTAGYYTVQFNASNLASGIYYYKIQYSGDQSFEKVMKMALLK